MLAFTGAAALEVGGARPASEEEPAEPPEQAAAQLQPTPEDLAPLAATLAPPEGFEATLMLTRRSKAFVHGDRRTRAVVDLPAGERIVGTCFAAQSTPEAVGSPVYPGYEAVRIPCAGMLRETCDALGCDDVVDACDVAVSVVVPCGTDPAPMAGGGPAAASAPGSAPSLALGPRSKVYSRQARDAVDVTALPGGEELLGECLLSASTRSRAGARVFPGYEPVTLRCRGSGERVCEALGCFSPDGVCEVLASNVHGCSP
jgi:hypothetical protein